MAALSGQQRGELAAALTAVCTCMGILHAWCMPCTPSVSQPERAERAYREYRHDLPLAHCHWAERLWCAPVLKSHCVLSNGYIFKRLASIMAAQQPREKSVLWEVRVQSHYDNLQVCLQ
jgi:hypothetical protein